MSAPSHTVLVYSSSAELRDTVRTALGRRPAEDLGRIEIVEASTVREFLAAVDGGGIDCAVLDGEARPAGGLGLAKQVKDELVDCPPTLVLLKRTGDSWLGAWSNADALLPLPVDARALREAVVALVRSREAGLPVRRAAEL